MRKWRLLLTALLVVSPGGIQAATLGVPSISSVSPNVGGPGTNVSIGGSEFAGTTEVRFNGRGASFTVNSNTSITATVPSGATTGPLTVTNAYGTATYNTFYMPPTITSFAPTGGPAGTYVVVLGSNFTVASGVQFGGVSASFGVENDSRLHATVPNGAGTGPITITYAGGSSSSVGSFVVGDPPAITQFSPLGGPVGTLVDIQGTNLLQVSEVDFAGVPASQVVVSSSEITATVPAGATTGPITVVGVTGSGTSAQVFFVGTAPVVKRFSPGSGQVGTSVHVYGSGFVSLSDVQFNGVGSAAFGAVSDTELVATVPSGATSGPISVWNPAGSGISPTAFAIGPTISSFWPSSVSARSATGTPVVITGESFTGASAVKFNGVPAGFAVNNDRQITATVPAGATTGPISVTNAAATTTSNQNFEVIAFGLPPRNGYATWPTSAYANVPASAAIGTQTNPSAASDSLGGVFVVWEDNRAGSWDIYAQRITAYGEVAPGWPTDGVVLCSAPGDQRNAKVIADGAGGMIAVWEDSRTGDWDLYAQRITASGSVASGWPLNGVRICGAPNQQSNPVITSDRSSGALIAWADYRNYNWDIYAQHILSSGQIAPGWFADGVAMCTDGSQQDTPAIAGDGTGGAYVAWHDTRYYDHIYLQYVTRDGSVPPQWPINGLRLGYYYASQYDPTVVEDGSGGALVGWTEARCYYDAYVERITNGASVYPGWSSDGVNLDNCEGNYQSIPALVADGAGGVFAAWQDNRCGAGWEVYANHVTGAGAIAAGWNPSGNAVTCTSGDQYRPQLILDGSGGIYVTWQDSRNSSYDIYAQRMSATGTPITGWTTNGVPVSLASNNQLAPRIVPGWGTGAVICWQDDRSGNGTDIYAQRLDWSGRLGDPQPILTSVEDLPSDQGGHVRLTWNASPLDVIPTLDISAYGVWRLVSTSMAQAAIAKGARVVPMGGGAVVAAPGTFRTTRVDAQTSYWEGVATILARGQGIYSYVAETFVDSTAAGNPKTTYMVDAHASFGPFFWDSNPDSGYSVDNIPPAMPAHFHVTYGPVAKHLGWDSNTDNDLSLYRIYRGSTPDFAPGPSNLLASVMDTAYVDEVVERYVYKIAAVDIHGNVSTFATVVPDAPTSVTGGPLPDHLWLGTISPNPVRAGTTLRFGLPTPTSVSLSVYDTGGRRVRDLVTGAMTAGVHTIVWDGLASGGQTVPSGLYFVRLSTTGGMLTQRMTILR